jgi:hypothetical protein
MKEDYIYHYKRRLIKNGIEDISATKLAEEAWLKYYSENKEELDLRLKRDKSWFEKSIDSEFLHLEWEELKRNTEKK